MGRNYTNPVYPFYFADPFVWKAGDSYFAVGTGPVAQKENAAEEDFTTWRVDGAFRAFPLLRSKDLTNWEMLGGALAPPDFALSGIFWAPEVTEHEGAFYLYYSVATEGLKHQLRCAVSARPEGPYRDAGPLMPPERDCPFAIDAHPFQDWDGQWYLFYARDFLDCADGARPGTALVMDRLLGMTRLAGQERVVLRPRCDWQLFQARREMYGRVFDWHTLEGPCVRFKDGRYYCFYSGGCYQRDNYGVDYGIAGSAWGPYTDDGYAAGPRVLKSMPGRTIGPGHQSIVRGPDNAAEFMVFHAWDPAMTARRMHIAPLVWTPEGPRCQLEASL